MPVQKASTLGLEPSFGFGDRLGLATPGHLEALKREGGTGAGSIKPIFAQQSIREMTRTKRTPKQVMAAAAKALKAEKYTDVWGADADHLKTEEDVEYTAAAGFVFFTIDPSAHVDTHADSYDKATLEAKFAQIKSQTPWVRSYEGKSVAIKDGPTIRFESSSVKRAAVKYGRAIAHTARIAAHIAKVMKTRGTGGTAYEIELSVDETPEPTTLAEHYIIADQLGPRSINLVSLAPRFIGDLEKGVDYKGNLKALEKSLNDHAAIARQLGPYKLSLHSGSDKISMYRLFARATRGMFHVKTAGTSYLEALRVVARHDAKLFRAIVDFARSRYDTDKATYHVSATLADAAPPSEVARIKQLEQIYLQDWSSVAKGKGFTNPGRQIMHCTFGSVLTDKKFGPAVRAVLEAHPDTHREVLADHFARHLAALRSGM